MIFWRSDSFADRAKIWPGDDGQKNGKDISNVMELDAIKKTYRIGDSEYPVLKEIDLKIEAGELNALMAPSGSGKSTLLNIVGCLDRPTSGRFVLQGQDISQTSDDEPARSIRAARGSVGGAASRPFLLDREADDGKASDSIGKTTPDLNSGEGALIL